MDTVDRTKRAPRVVAVGIDGSPGSLAALSWAADLVGADGVLHAVHALSTLDAVALAAVQGDWAALHSERRRVLEDEWTAAARGRGIKVVCDVIEAGPAPAIVQLAGSVDADLMVVGRHGQSRGRPRMVGGNTHRLLHDSDLPVVVVGPERARPIEPGGTVAVGVGHGAATTAALDWAMDFAGAQSLALELVRVVNHQPLLLPSLNVEQGLAKAAQLLAPDLLRAWAEDDLARAGDHLAARPAAPTVAVARRVEFGATGPALVEASRNASLLVMGKHFDGPLTGYFISSSLHHVLTHATVPVVVVPERPTGA